MRRRREARRTMRHLQEGGAEPDPQSFVLPERLEVLRERLRPWRTRAQRLRARGQRGWYAALARLPGSVEPRRLVVLAEERIGVDRLVWLLNRHPKIRIEPVRFGPAVGAEPQEQIDNLRAALSVRARPSVQVLGVHFGVRKLLDLDGIRELLHEARPCVVHVTHDNAVRAAIFLEGMLFSKTWIRDWERIQVEKAAGQTPPRPQRTIPFNRRTFTTRLRRVEIAQVRLRRFVDSLDLEVHRLSERELLRDERSVVKDVLGCIGLEAVDVAPLVSADSRYLELFDDPEALHAHLEDTPYLAMLEELGSEG